MSSPSNSAEPRCGPTTPVQHPDQHSGYLSAHPAGHPAVRDLAKLYETLAGYASRMSLRFAGPVALITWLLAWAVNGGRNPVPFTGDPFGFGALIFFLGILSAFIVGAAAFIVGIRYRNSLAPAHLHKSWVWTFLPLAVAHALVIGLFAGLGIQFIDQAFKELALPPVYSHLLVGMTCGFIAYTVANRSLQMQVQKVAGLFVTVLVGGIALSAVTVNSPLWWEQSFSFLGMQGSTARMVFNFTLIMSGILLIVMQQFFIDDFAELRERHLISPRTVRWMRVSLVALGLLMALIGLIPFGEGSLRDQVHDLSAYSVAGILLVYMLLVRKLVPYFSPEFYTMTWGMAALLVVAVVLHLTGSINTVGVELLSFVLGGAWFMLFIKNVDLLAEHIGRYGVSPGTEPGAAAMRRP